MDWLAALVDEYPRMANYIFRHTRGGLPLLLFTDHSPKLAKSDKQQRQ